MGEIELDGLSKRYGDVVAVDDVTGSFSDGSYTMILGPSGSGKSTLLRMIAGLETPDAGDVLIDGEVVTDRPSRDRGLSMVFQNLALWDHKTVRENMAFGLKMHGVEADEREARVEDVAELLEIEDKLDANPVSLSGGQQQRVALGRSLVRQPEVVLLDEPLSSLDEQLRLRMRTELKRIQQETGTTFVHVTHNQEDAMTVADEILLIEAGRIQQFGDPLDLYERPRTEFVAGFIGSPGMNLFDGEFVDDDPPRFEFGEGTLALPADSGERFRDAISPGPIRVGVRPESLSVAGASDGSDPWIEGTVRVVETFGDFNWYYLDSALDSEVVMQSADEEVMATLSAGDELTVTVPSEKIHVFDPESGEALR